MSDDMSLVDPSELVLQCYEMNKCKSYHIIKLGTNDFLGRTDSCKGTL